MIEAQAAQTVELHPNKNLIDNNYMAKPLTKSQLAATVADASGVTKKTATEILDLLAQLSYKHAKDGFTLPGIGKLVLVSRKARMGRNPRTGQSIQISASNSPAFKAGKGLKDAVN